MTRTNQNEHRERALTGKARMNAYKDRVAETERVRERQKAQGERGAGRCALEPGTEEQMADRHAVAAGEDRDNTTRQNDRHPLW